ncbi:hypothetical protein D3C72_1581860 [compost metagenome]
MISVISGAANRGSKGPKPTASSSTSLHKACLARSSGKSTSDATICVSKRSASARNMPSLMPATSRRRRSSASSKAACRRRRACTRCGAMDDGGVEAIEGEAVSDEVTTTASEGTGTASKAWAGAASSGSTHFTRKRQGPIRISSSGRTGA